MGTSGSSTQARLSGPVKRIRGTRRAAEWVGSPLSPEEGALAVAAGVTVVIIGRAVAGLRFALERHRLAA
jgi:hypothetical protein